MTTLFSANNCSGRSLFRQYSLSSVGILALAIAVQPAIATAQTTPVAMTSAEDAPPPQAAEPSLAAQELEARAADLARFWRLAQAARR